MICPPVLPFRKQNSIELNHCIRDSMPITPDGSAHQDASLNAGLKLVQETDQGYQNLRFERLIGEEKLQSTGHLRVTMFAWPTTSPTWYGVNFLPYECDSIRTRWHLISHLEFGCPVLLYWLLVWNVQAHACVSFCVLYSVWMGLYTPFIPKIQLTLFVRCWEICTIYIRQQISLRNSVLFPPCRIWL